MGRLYVEADKLQVPTLTTWDFSRSEKLSSLLEESLLGSELDQLFKEFQA
jgi:hypothetical protein